MNMRSMHTSMPLAVGFFCLALAPQVTLAEGLPKSCQETTERVLKPFLDNLKAAQKALQQYEKQNAEKIARINDQIRLRQEAKRIFDDARAKENEDFGNRIKWGNEAVREANADAQKRIAEQRKLAAEARAKKRDHDVKRHNDIAAGKIQWYKQELRLKCSIKDWHHYIRNQTQARAKRMADYAAGKVTHYIQTLRWKATWQGVQESIATKREEFAKAQRREYAYYLQAIRIKYDGKGIDAYLALRQEELADARARIAAGTFVVYVPALRLKCDRNAIQQIVAGALKQTVTIENTIWPHAFPTTVLSTAKWSRFRSSLLPPSDHTRWVRLSFEELYTISCLTGAYCCSPKINGGSVMGCREVSLPRGI